MKMIYSVKNLLIIFSLTATIGLDASELTKESVHQLITKLDNAISHLDANGVAKVISKDAKIVMHIEMQGNSQMYEPSKQEYISMLQDGWDLYTNYKYKRSNLVIKIHKNKATVTADISESMIVGGQKFSGESKEEIIIEMVEGTPIITHVTGFISM